MEALDLLRINHSRLVRFQWRSIRHEQCQVSRLAKTARANPKERARARMLSARAKERREEQGSETSDQDKAVPEILRILREVGTQACRLKKTHRGW